MRVAFKRHKSLVQEAIIPQLASIFQVSIQAMALRLRDLNLNGRRYENVMVVDFFRKRKRHDHAPIVILQFVKSRPITNLLVQSHKVLTWISSVIDVNMKFVLHWRIPKI